MLDGLASPTPIAALVAGALLLVFGRKLFWLFVGVVGFVVAWRLTGAYFGDAGIGWVLAVVVGLVGAAAAVLVQRLVVGVAGFAAGVIGFLWLAELLGWALGLPTLIGAAVAGALGAALLGWLFELGLIALSSLAGAALVVEGLGRGDPVGPAFFVLAVVGALIQLGGRHRRRKKSDDE